MLNATNYTVWAMKMMRELKVHKAWDVIEKTIEPFDEEKSDVAMALLFQSIPEALCLQIGELYTAKKCGMRLKQDMWE